MKKKVLLMMKKRVSCHITGKHRVITAAARHLSRPLSDKRCEGTEMAERIRTVGNRLAGDPAAAKAILIRTGMYESDGKLKKEFK